MPEEKVVNQGSPDQTPLAEAIASSPEVKEEVQQSQEAQTQPAETEGVTQEQTEQEEARIPYSRFKEKVDEANWYKQNLERLMQERQAQQIQQPTTNPYAGMTPEEERFWRAVDERARKIAKEETQTINPMLEAGVRELTNMKVQQFRSAHPDIKPNSIEENEIATRIRQGYSPDDAYWATMGPRGIRVAEEKGKQQVKQQIAAKKAANTETSSVTKQSFSNQTETPFPKTALEREQFLRKSRERFREDMRKNLEAAT